MNLTLSELVRIEYEKEPFLLLSTLEALKLDMLFKYVKSVWYGLNSFGNLL